jgi:hypothetical protein
MYFIVKYLISGVDHDGYCSGADGGDESDPEYDKYTYELKDLNIAEEFIDLNGYYKR